MASSSNLTQAKDLLDSMTDEVEDLHPVLKILLPLLPNVTDCEYTHGRDEWGADFVLTLSDTTLGGFEHIGVIAKRGAIKQDLKNVDTQIEECRLSLRKVRGGTKQIELDRIWIISTGAISKNAKDKIHLKHRGTGLSFIDAPKLAQLIVRHAPFIANNVTAEIGDYLTRVRTKIEARKDRRDMLAMTGDTPEIELEIAELKRDLDGRARQEIVKLDEVAERSTEIVILEGRAGAGKTRELEKLAERYATATEYKRIRKVPVLLTARDVRDQYDWDIVKAIDNELGHDTREKLKRETSGILLLVDGLDEVPEDVEERRLIIDNIKIELAEEWPQHGVIITTRSGDELFLTRDPGIRHIVIKAVTLQKLVAFIMETCKNVQMPTRLAEDLKNSDLFRQLPQNPIAAILLSRVIREDGKELPSSLTEIYSKATELMLGRWDQRKGIVAEKEYLVIRYVMEKIAKEMVENRMWEVGKTWIEAEFADYIEERKLNISKDKVTRQALSRTGVLVENTHKGTVEFKHVSFMEFLYASGWEPDKEERRQKMYDHGWAEIYFFYVGLQRNGERFLEEALDREETEMVRRWRKVLAAPAYMMAGWTAPYRIVEAQLGKLLIDAAKVFLYLRDERGEEAADEFTEVQLLYVLQATMRRQYSYNHFKEAIDTAVVHILDWQQLDGNQEAGFYALAFAALIGSDLDEDEPLRVLIEDTRTNRLPPALALGLEIEGRTDRDVSDRFKKLYRVHKKRLTKAINRDVGLRQYLRNQVLVPIKRVKGRKDRAVSDRVTAKDTLT